MVRDYSEKRGGREAVERRPVAKNRPRREGGGMLLFAGFLVLGLTYGAGLGTGWFFFKHRAPAPAAVQPAKKQEPVPAPTQEPKPDPQLTFYKTLPTGGKGAMGTGLNLKKPEQLPAPRVIEVAPPQAAPGTATDQAPTAAPAAPAASTDAATQESSVRFVVQVASYRDKQEAVSAQSKLSAKGLPAYLVELKVADKGVWYRLRVGRHLTKGEAGEMAARAGKGAIVLPE